MMTGKRKIVCVDWDDTLVDAKTQQWLPGAEHALYVLARNYRVVIWTSRASWPEGYKSVHDRLAQLINGPRMRAQFEIKEKVSADIYIDNRALKFEGDWEATLAALKGL